MSRADELVNEVAAKGTSRETSRFSDLGNAESLVEWHEADLRYVHAWGKWLSWDTRRWSLDDTGGAMRCARETSRRLLAEASGDAAVEWARTSQSAQKLNAMLHIAKSDLAVAVTHNCFDADPMLLNVANGTIDLRTGKLRPHRREDLITKIAPASFDPAATCPTWLAFVEWAMRNNSELVAFLQRWTGYVLTGRVDEHALVFAYGGGENGKSTYTKTILAMLGEYATVASRTLLFATKNEQHATEIAALYRARFVVCPEVQKGQSFDEAKVKDLTGGDPISARRMREDPWPFNPTHKFALNGNHKPVIRGDDEGIWRRLLLVPFEAKLKPEEKDPQLGEKLVAGLPGILRWAVDGCLAWQRDGLRAPSEVRSATAAYRSESDPLGEFFALQCAFGPDYRAPRAMIRKAYEDFCEENGIKPSERVDAKAFAKRLRVEGCDDCDVRVNGQVKNGWRGVRLLDESERETRSRAKPSAASVLVGTDSPIISSTRAHTNGNVVSVPTATDVPTDEGAGSTPPSNGPFDDFDDFDDFDADEPRAAEGAE